MLGLLRHEGGRPYPLEQAEFFCEVFSLDSDSTVFYRIDEMGSISTRNIPLVRGRDGYISGLCGGESILYFERDDVAHITDLEVHPNLLLPVEGFEATAGDGAIELEWTNPIGSRADSVLTVYSTDHFPWGPSAGTPVENGSDGVFLSPAGEAVSFVHSDLEVGFEYFYCAFTRDEGTASWVVRANAILVDTAAQAVELFPPTVEGACVRLAWTEHGDGRWLGYHIWRKDLEAEEEYTGITTSPLSTRGDYTYADCSASPGRIYSYLIEGFDGSERAAKYGPLQVEVPSSVERIEMRSRIVGRGQPAIFWIDLPVGKKISIDLFDLLGRKVDSLVEESLSPGEHEFRWHGLSGVGRQVAPGVYFSLVRVGNRRVRTKIIVMR
jgi:hypothetical protein